MTNKANIEPMFRHLLRLVRFNPVVSDEAAALLAATAFADAFCQKWATESKFIQYFKAQWLPKLGEGIHLLR